MTKSRQRMSRVISTGVAAVLILTGLTLAGTLHADAATTGITRGAGLETTYLTQTMRISQYSTSNGIGYCPEPSKYTAADQKLSDPVTITSLTNDQGGNVNTNRLHAIAALLSLHGNTSDNRTAAAVELALRDLLNLTHARLWPGSASTYSWQLDDANSAGSQIATQLGVRTLAIQLRDEAYAKSNNWDGTGQLTLDHTQSTQPGDTFIATVNLPGIDGTLGHGWKVDFHVTSPDGTVETIHTTTSSSVAKMTYTAKAGVYGTFKIDATLLDAVPPAWPKLATAEASDHQSLLLSGGGTRGWSSGAVTFKQDWPAPTITTQISDQIVLPGQTISDTAILGHLVVGNTVSYFVSGSLVTTPALPDGSCPPAGDAAWRSATSVLKIPDTPVPTASIKQDGTAKIVLGQWTAPTNATAICASYGEVVRMHVPGQTDVTVEHPAGDVPQTGLVLGVPTLTSKASMQLANPGDIIHDTLYLGNMAIKSNVTYTLAGGIYAVPPLSQGVCPKPDDAVWATAEKYADIESLTVTSDMISPDGTMTVVTSGWAVPQQLPASCYSYGGTLTASIAGNDYTYTTTHQAGDPLETVYVVSGVVVAVEGGGNVASFPLASWLAVLMLTGVGGVLMYMRRRA